MTTTTAIDGRPLTEYVAVVTGEAVLGANVLRDLSAGLMDIVGGRSAGHERCYPSRAVETGVMWLRIPEIDRTPALGFRALLTVNNVQ